MKVVTSIADVTFTVFTAQPIPIMAKPVAVMVEAASVAHRVISNRYEGGLANYLEVLYVEDLLLNSLRTLTSLQSRDLTLDIALKHALGGGYQHTK